MKNLGNALVILGVLIVIYAIAGRLIGQPGITLGQLQLKASSGITMATFCVALGIAVKMWDK